MNVAYIRVSSLDQNEDRQIESMKNKNIDKFFSEKISGKNLDRPELQKMLNFVRSGDRVYVHDFSRLARNTKDLLEIVEILEKKEVSLICEKECIDTSTDWGKMLVTILSAVYEMERKSILERQKEGIAIAKRAGKYKGGKPKKISKQKLMQYKTDIEEKRITKVRASELLGISRPTLDKLLKSM